MGEFDFNYALPANFNNRVVQYLQLKGYYRVAEAFKNCKNEYEDQGLAYYAGLRGDNWNKRAVDFTLEGEKAELDILKSQESFLKDAIGKALKPSESGFLVREIYFFELGDEMVGLDIPKSNEERLKIDIAASTAVLNDLIRIGERVCSNHTYDASRSENSINDYFRDMLIGMGYNEVKDQTRHGISLSGKDAGEVDILLTKGGKEIAIFEGLKLSRINTGYLDEHIFKSIVNYNALGTATFVVAYVNVADFEAFWDRYTEHIQQFEFPMDIKIPFNVMSHPNAATRVGTMILRREGFDFPVYFIAFKIT